MALQSTVLPSIGSANAADPRFTNCEGKTARILYAKGQPVAFEQWSDETETYLQVRADDQPLTVI